MKKINRRIRRTGERGLFHDTRSDMRVIIEVYNDLHDKVNELIDVINEQEKHIEDLEKKVERNKITSIND